MPVEPVGVDRKFYTAHLQEGMCWQDNEAWPTGGWLR